MHIHESGSGATRIVLVPGGPSLPAEFYRELTGELEKTTRVVTYRQRGAYPNIGQDYPRSVAAIAEELEEVLHKLPESPKDPPPVVLGHSMGGAVVIEALCRRVEVSGAIVMSGFSSGRMLAEGIAERVAELPAEFHRRYADTDPHDSEAMNALLAEFWFPRHFCRVAWPDSFSESVPLLNPDYLNHFIGPSLFEPDGVVMDWDRQPQLNRIEAPTLFIGGTYDYFRLSDVEAMHRAVPNSSLWISEVASHSPWIEDPDATFTTISRFLRGTL